MLKPNKEAQKILSQLNIKDTPVDVRKIAEELGARVIEKSSPDDDSGMIYINGDDVIIGLNKDHHENRKRFTLAHEIGHLVLHKNLLMGSTHVDKKFGVKLNRDKRSSLGKDFLEIQANQFAAELLIPRELLKLDIKDSSVDFGDRDDEEIQRLAKKYQVSSQAMYIKLLQSFKSDLFL